MRTLRRLSFLPIFVLLHLTVAAQRASHPAVTTGIRLSLPDITGPVWIYIDSRLVEAYQPSEKTTQKWIMYPLPYGFEVLDDNGDVAKYYSKDKRFYFYDTATTQQRQSLFRTWQLSAKPGPHKLEVLYPISNSSPYYSAGKNYQHLFPFLISSAQVEVDTANLTPVSPDLPDGWQPPMDLQIATPLDDICKDGKQADTAKLIDGYRVYKEIPVILALHAQPAPMRSGTHTVVTLDLPPDLGGTREFDGTEIDIIATAISDNSDSIFPYWDDATIKVCSQMYPNFASSYRIAKDFLRKIYDDIASFHALARKLNGQP